ncbi:tRNA CCA-pyrophosphorylase [Enterobacter cloacae]|nr:tRNA CCA-pyrophosphorylase [Enterobacter cloacae]VAM16787.1 tRNA CCA-pyrophosphorylase [Enterobacter kobei]
MADSSKFIESVFDKLPNWTGYPVFKELFMDDKSSPIYLSGGVLRNTIMGNRYKTKDYDFFITGNDFEIKLKELEKYGNVFTTPYGAPRWFPKNSNLYADLMPISSFSPGLWPCSDIIDVLNQFDFTMNALAIELNTQKIFDPVNGMRDASQKVLKMVRFDYPAGPFIPEQKIDRNAILWIRAIHYTSKYHLRIEPITLSWIKKNKHFKDSTPLFSDIFFKPEKQFLLEGII